MERQKKHYVYNHMELSNALFSIESQLLNEWENNFCQSNVTPLMRNFRFTLGQLNSIRKILDKTGHKNIEIIYTEEQDFKDPWDFTKSKKIKSTDSIPRNETTYSLVSGLMQKLESDDLSQWEKNFIKDVWSYNICKNKQLTTAQKDAINYLLRRFNSSILL